MPRKRKSKNLVLPILGFSLFSMLGITLYLNRPRPTTLTIAEVAAPSSNCATVAFSDTFSGNTLDANNWTVEINDLGESTGIVSNELVSTSPEGLTGLRLMSKKEITGDFISTIDLKTPSTTGAASSAKIAYLAFRSLDQGNFVSIGRDGNGQVITYINGDLVNNTFISTDVAPTQIVTIKVIRTGSSFKTYYKTTGSFILLGDYPNITDSPVTARVNLGMGDSAHNLTTTAVFDNFSLKCRPPMPTGLNSTCSSDGKKVALKWDDISPSHKYHFALNDPSNDTSSSWYVANSTDVWRGGDYNSSTYELPIIPNHKYDWWIQSNSDGPSSDLSDIAKSFFTCEPKPPAPLNPRITCNPDGKSVRLMWDGVTDIETYKVRLDDKNGKVTNYDNLKEPQYIVTILPDKMYSFWVHSHKGDIDSNQSTAIDFSCKVTSTPTPKPTVKPTAKPISKGDEVSIPSDTPKPSVKATVTPKSSPTNPSYVAPSPVSTYPEATEKPVSKNPISRFFSWLASLFE